MQVLSKLKKVEPHSYHGDVGCRVKFVSTCAIEEHRVPTSARWGGDSCGEIPTPCGRNFIDWLISDLKEEGNNLCPNMFLLKEYGSHMRMKGEPLVREENDDHILVKKESWDEFLM